MRGENGQEGGMRAAPRKPRVAQPASRRLALGTMALLLAGVLMGPGAIFAEGDLVVAGRVVNGSSGAPAPANLEVTIHKISRDGGVDVATALTDANGAFKFHAAGLEDGSTYALAATYGDVLYSVVLDTAALGRPVELVVYEPTAELEGLSLGADVLLLRSAEGGRRMAAFEAATLVNSGNRTFVPDLAQPERMRFLRFSLPPGAADLEVTSDLPEGGSIVNVGSGFALVAPVKPGSHQVVYSYVIPYEGGRLELTHSFPVGAGAFRLLLEESTGLVLEPAPLTPLPTVRVEGKTYRVWEATGLVAGARLTVQIGGLPQPGPFRRLGDALGGGPYLKVGIPAAVGLVLVCLLAYGAASKKRRKTPAHVPRPGDAPGYSGGSEVESRPERQALLEAMARLDDLWEGGGVEEVEYQRRRLELKARLVQLAISSQGE